MHAQGPDQAEAPDYIPCGNGQGERAQTSSAMGEQRGDQEGGGKQIWILELTIIGELVFPRFTSVIDT